MQEKTLEEELKDLTCVNGAMYFGAVEHPCSGREMGECCQNEQTYEEAFAELLSFISSREEKAREEGRKEEQQLVSLELANELLSSISSREEKAREEGRKEEQQLVSLELAKKLSNAV